LNSKRNVIELFFLIAVASAINIAFFYGFITRPVIFYNLSTSIEYNETIDFLVEPLNVTLHARNEGLSPAKIGFVIRLYNTSLLNHEPDSTQEYESVRIVDVPLEKAVKPNEEANYSIALTPHEDASYLILVFTVVGESKLDLFKGYYNSFAKLEATRPNALIFKQYENGKYMRVKKR